MKKWEINDNKWKIDKNYLFYIMNSTGITDRNELAISTEADGGMKQYVEDGYRSLSFIVDP